jgi:hypothetical protein
MGKSDRKPDNPAQPKLTDTERHKRFVEVARKVEADETEEGADRALKSVILTPKPSKKGG